MRTTVTIDDDVYEAALSQARATGQRLGGTPLIPASRIQETLDDDGIV